MPDFRCIMYSSDQTAIKYNERNRYVGAKMKNSILLLHRSSILIRDIFHACTFMDDEDLGSGKKLRGRLCIVGICAYYVSGIKPGKLADELMDFYARMTSHYDRDLNPQELTYEGAKKIIKSDYQKARDIVEKMDKDSRGIGTITIAHKDLLIKILGKKPSERDQLIIVEQLINFYDAILMHQYSSR